MTARHVIILDKDQNVSAWLMRQLGEIGVEARHVPSVTDLIDQAGVHSPTVCLVGLRAPVAQVLNLVTALSQEPRFSHTAFILMGPPQYKHAGFEAGADDYLTTPPDVIELRKRIRLYLDRAALEERVASEARAALEDRAGAQSPAAEPRAHPAWELLARYTTTALALMHPDGSPIQTNPAWDTLSRTRPWPPNDPFLFDEMSRAARQGTPWQGVARGTRPDGTPWTTQISLTPLRGSTGQVTGLVISQVDVTNGAGANGAPFPFQPGDISEIRSALSSLKLRQHVLARTPPEQQAAQLAILENETNRLSDMVEQLVLLQRLDQDLARLSVQPISLGQLAADVITRYLTTAESRGVSLDLDSTDFPLTVLGDPGHISRAVGTLVHNAIQHTPKGGSGTLSVFTRATSDGPQAVIQVRDTGEGIPADVLPRIFERTYRASRTGPLGDPEGNLRLVMVRDIIARHEGTLIAESEPGQGSLFTIALPLFADQE